MVLGIAENLVFSSPLGAFVFYIKTENYFNERKRMWFSSPLGDFVFYMLVFDMDGTIANLFSSPLGDFVFYI